MNQVGEIDSPGIHKGMPSKQFPKLTLRRLAATVRERGIDPGRHWPLAHQSSRSCAFDGQMAPVTDLRAPVRFQNRDRLVFLLLVAMRVDGNEDAAIAERFEDVVKALRRDGKI